MCRAVCCGPNRTLSRHTTCHPIHTLCAGSMQPTSSRLKESRVWTKASRPGPGAYDLKSSMGAASPTAAHAPAYTCGKLTHDGANILKTAGSGKYYEIAGGLGRADARKPSSPKSPGFGTSKREAVDATYSIFTFRPA